MSGSVREPAKGRKRWGWAILVSGAFAAGLLLMGLTLLWPFGGDAPPPKASPFSGGIPGSAVEEDPAAAGSAPRLAIVVGDLGYEPVRDAEWLDFPEKITLSVLPFGPSSRTVAATAQSRGYGVILHVPMEPRSPSSDATEPFRLRRDMDGREIAERLDRMTQEVPQAVGAINHMGSAFTADPAAMDAFAAALRERGLFFIDTVTTSGSVGLDASRKAGIPAVRRDVFLDNDPDPGSMRRQWEKAIAMAKANGKAVLVCRSRRETLNALLGMVPELEKEGVRPVTVRELFSERPPPGRPAGEV